jgi:hypothetical protein
MRFYLACLDLHSWGKSLEEVGLIVNIPRVKFRDSRRRGTVRHHRLKCSHGSQKQKQKRQARFLVSASRGRSFRSQKIFWQNELCAVLSVSINFCTPKLGGLMKGSASDCSLFHRTFGSVNHRLNRLIFFKKILGIVGTSDHQQMFEPGIVGQS